MIKLSIALVTRNSQENLKTVLTSVFSQKSAIYEVIISDDSNDEDFIQQNRLISQNFGCKYISGPQKGLYANRNYVLKNCSGTHIRTMDDDHTFPENHFSECFKAIESEPNTIWTIGEYLIRELNRPLPSPIAGQLDPRGFSYAPKEMENYYGISCGGTIYPKFILSNNVLNLEYYKFGIMYLEYGARLKKLGYTIKALRTTYLIHNDEKTTASELSVNIIQEARLFSMLSLSFLYQPSFSNKFKTIFQITIEVIKLKYNFITINRTLEKFREFKVNFNRIK
jgi:glycosyltransferase involved in cell wall biosynthesis